MTTIVTEIYDALRKAGLDEETARKAAQAVLGAQEREQLVTKEFLRAELNGLRAEIQAMLNRQFQIMIGLMIAMTGIFAAIVKLF
ncbi:MAG: hypothetical protein ACREXW_19505 [Gammaproteobacteria bacterium]